MYSQTLLKSNLLYCLFHYQPYNLVIKADTLHRGLSLKIDLQKWHGDFRVSSFRDSIISFSLQCGILPEPLVIFCRQPQVYQHVFFIIFLHALASENILPAALRAFLKQYFGGRKLPISQD